MDQKMKRKFQVIGACTRTQTLSLEEEISLLSGIPYDLDIFQDFSNCQLNGGMTQYISTSALCKLLDGMENIDEPNASISQHVSEISYQERQQVQKMMKKASKEAWEEYLWEEKHNEISAKKAEKQLKRALRNLGVDPDDF